MYMYNANTYMYHRAARVLRPPLHCGADTSPVPEDYFARPYLCPGFPRARLLLASRIGSGWPDPDR